MMEEVTGNDILSGRSISVVVDGAVVVAVREVGPGGPEDPWLAPGLVDLQVNGFGDVDLNVAPEPDRIEDLTRELAAKGVTTFCPTVITGAPASMMRALAALACAIRERPVVAGAVAAIHLEGPFISPIDGPRGAHDQAWVRAPDAELLRRFQEAADDRIGIITLSPEWPGAPDFIGDCVASGLVVAIGHTAASAYQIREAIRAGATLSTHLGNGTHVDLPRHDNYVWEQLAADDLWASLIADGVHLPVAVLTSMVRTKGARAVLVSDAVGVASAPGTYSSSIGASVTVTADRAVRLAADGRLLAGAIRPLSDGVAHLVANGITDLPTAWAMASARPAAVLGLPPRVLQPGAPADLVRFQLRDTDLLIETVVTRGRIVDTPSIALPP